jgi:hypothetical protein
MEPVMDSYEALASIENMQEEHDVFKAHLVGEL